MLSTVNTPLLGKSSCWDGLTNFAFFFVGIGGDIVLPAVVINVAYYRQILGDAVLAKLGGAHFVCAVSAMLIAPMIQTWFPSVRVQFAMLAMSLVGALGAVVYFLAQVVFGLPLNEGTILFVIAINGVCVGVCQETGAALAGMVRAFSDQQGTSTAQMQGAAFGIASVTILQLVVIALNMFGVKLQDPVRFGLYLIYPFVIANMCVALFSIVILSRLSFWDHATTSNRATQRARRRSKYSSNRQFNQALLSIMWTRTKQLWPVATAMFMANLCTVFLLQLSPVLRVATESPLMVTYFVTFIVAIANIMDWLGRSSYTMFAKNSMFPAAWTMILIRLGMCIALLILLAIGPRPAGFYFPFYLASSLMGGLAIVLVGEHGQMFCGHDSRAPCPATAITCWIFQMLGALAGTMCSTIYMSHLSGATA